MNDRGMKKWAPYKALNEQWDNLDNLEKEEFAEKPKLSNEEAEAINDRLVNYSGEEITIYYYKRGKIYKEKSTIKKIDAFEKRLKLDNGVTISLKDLVGIK